MTEVPFKDGGLNPCFSGTYPRRRRCFRSGAQCYVLILVLVEHTLGVLDTHVIEEGTIVLILVLVEHTLGVQMMLMMGISMFSLNPCFSGTYPRSATFTTYTISKYYACKFGIFICF